MFLKQPSSGMLNTERLERQIIKKPCLKCLSWLPKCLKCQSWLPKCLKCRSWLPKCLKCRSWLPKCLKCRSWLPIGPKKNICVFTVTCQ